MRIKQLIINLKRAKYSHDKIREQKRKEREEIAQTKIVPVTNSVDIVMKEEVKRKDETESDVVTVLVIKNDESMNNGFGQSFTIMIPAGYGISVFRRLVYSGCKSIGHKEYRSIKLECG
jgi:hypothetical protein